MLSAAGQAFRDLFTPPFRAVLFKCVAFTIGLLVLLIVGIEWTFSYFVQWPDWIEKSIQWLGGLALVVGSIFLIAPVTSLIAGLYLDDIAAVVEREHYPADPPGQELPTLQAVGVALRFFIIVLLVSLVALFLLLIPGINLIAFYLGNGYLTRSRIFRARGDAARSAGRGEDAQAGEPAYRVPRRADHRRHRLGADPEPDHAALRHRFHGSHV